MHVKTSEHECIQKKAGGEVTLQQDVHQLEDQNQDDFLAFIDKLFDKYSQDVRIDNRVDTIHELGQINHAGVGVISNLYNRIVEKVCNDSQDTLRNDGNSALLSVGDLQDSS